MPNAEDVLWFKQQFGDAIARAVQNTPFDLDMLTAVACQETGSIWPVLRRKNLATAELLRLCVGDTLDADRGRRAFPKTKAELIAAPNGEAMFNLAHQALVDMAQHITAYQPAAKNANKFCHGYGIFQVDLQFFRTDPDYFLQQRYADFALCAARCVDELKNAQRRNGWQDKTTLTEQEMAGVAIAYNTGSFNPAKGLKQGFFDGQKFYGESFFDFLRLAKTVALPGGPPAPLPTPEPGNAVVPPPTPIAATGPFFRVRTQEGMLRLRSAPTIPRQDRTANVIGQLPVGHLVRAVTGTKVNNFIEVETSLSGANLRGFASADFLEPVPDSERPEIPVVEPAPAPPTSGIVAVFAPRAPGTVTKRTAPASALSLNEPGQPAGRQGTTPDALRAELAAIIDWLAVDKAANKRYQPRTGVTFCNIYAHDFCFLAGVYLPRVWWTPRAIEILAQGGTVEPLLGNTIVEVRANDLFRWLRDFGPRFGWRQTGTLTKLQQEVNQGAIGLIVARRKEDGRSGHIVAVVPETDDERAKRDATGAVIAPLQSQAGATNFRYGTGRLNWWTEAQFAESAFWLHA